MRTLSKETTQCRQAGYQLDGLGELLGPESFGTGAGDGRFRRAARQIMEPTAATAVPRTMTNPM